MNYYLEKISKKRQQLEIAKKGLVQVANDYKAAKAKAVYADDEKAERAEYARVKELAEQLSAGLELINELEKDMDYLHGKFKEEQEKEKNKEGKKQ